MTKLSRLHFIGPPCSYLQRTYRRTVFLRKGTTPPAELQMTKHPTLSCIFVTLQFPGLPTASESMYLYAESDQSIN